MKTSSSNKEHSFSAKGGVWLWLPLLAFLWESIRLLTGVSPLLMPSLWSIAREFVLGITSGNMALRWLISLSVVAAGLAAGTLLALMATMLTRVSKGMENLFTLLSTLMHPLPGLALLPLVILWFGTGYSAVLVIIIHAVMWPVFVNLQSGLRSLPESWTLYTRNLGMGKTSGFLLVELPGSFPYLISGIRTGWARSWRSFIAAEMVFGAVGGRGGLGWQLFESRVMMDTAALYAALLAVMITGLVVEGMILNRWENAVRGKWGET